MALKSKLDRRINSWALLEHPFYKAWEAGELPMDALQTYAREYGAFINLLPAGWQTLGDEATAQEEVEHSLLWGQFASGLGTQSAAGELPAVKDLISIANELFAQRFGAAGALYAFEVQQPETAQSKLHGLQTHYNLPKRVEHYFIEHSHNEHEAEKLLQIMTAFSDEEQNEALDASERISAALWEALSDIYNGYQSN